MSGFGEKGVDGAIESSREAQIVNYRSGTQAKRGEGIIPENASGIYINSANPSGAFTQVLIILNAGRSILAPEIAIRHKDQTI